MTDPKELHLRRLKDALPDRVSRQGDPRYDQAAAIWAKPAR